MRATLVAFVILAVLAAGLCLAQPKARNYIPVSAYDVAVDPEKYVGSFLQIKDEFGEKAPEFAGKTKEFSRWATQNRITPDKYMSFMTSDTTGSNMQCYVPKTDERTVKLLDGLPEGTKIILYGRLEARALGLSHFLVDRVVLGHEAKPEAQTVQILMTIGDKTFRITRSGEYSFACANAKDKKEKVRIEIKVGDQVVK